MSFQEILNDLKNKIYKPIYLFMGEEPYYGDELTKYIADNVLSESEKAFNQTIIYGKDSKANNIADLCRRFPMMANNQVVILKEAQDLRDFNNLLEYCQNPLPSTVFVINYKYKKVKKNTKIYKAIAKNGVVLESSKKYDYEMPKWIKNYVSEKGKKIDEKAVLLLSEYVGTQLSKMANEIDKLIVAIEGKTDTITADTVSENIGISKEYSVFDLTNALAERNSAKAMKIAIFMGNNQKENPVQLIIPSVFSFFHKVLTYKLLKDKSQRNIYALFGTSANFVIKYYKLAATKYDNKKLFQIMSLLREYDLKTKGVNAVNISPLDIMKELTFKILH